MSRLTVKQEAFAQAYVETGNASEAYRRAYDASNMKETSVWRKAKELIDNGKVAARIGQLQSRAQKKHDITVARLTEMASAAYELAMKEGVEMPAAAVSAVMALGKLHGLIVDKKHVTTRHEEAELTDAELEAIATGRSTGLAETQAGPSEPDRLH